jgi:hypothetical protein
MKKIKLTIFIVTRDRPEFFKKAIDSAINQTYKSEYKIIISDNSISNETKHLAARQYPNIEYVRRNNISVFDHFQIILKENKSEFLVMLHDDDSLCSTYCEVALSRMLISEYISAIATRPYYFYLSGQSLNINKKNSAVDEVIDNPAQLLRLYFYENKSINPPFTSYMYRKSSIEGLKFNSKEAGKYSDLTFLLKILETGKFLWLKDKLVNIGIHDSNDSNIESMASYFKLINYLKIKYNFGRDNKLIKALRITIYVRYLRNNIKFKRRKFIFIKFVLLNIDLLAKILYFKNF